MFFLFRVYVLILPYTKRNTMKEMIKTLVEAAKEDPKEFITGVIAITGVFVGLWASLWFVAIIQGRV